MQYNLHTHSTSKRSDVLEIVNQYPNELDENRNYFSIGIHPWYIDIENLTSDLKQIEQVI